MLVHLVAVWISFLQVVQAKRSIRFDVQAAASAHTALVTVWETNDCSIVMSPVSNASHVNVQGSPDVKSSSIVYGAPLCSRTAVLEPRYM